MATCLRLPSHLSYITPLRSRCPPKQVNECLHAFRCRWCPSGVPDSTLWDCADPCVCSSASPGKWGRRTPHFIPTPHPHPVPLSQSSLAERPICFCSGLPAPACPSSYLPSSYSSFPTDGCDRAASWEQQQPHRATGGKLGRHPQHQE